MSLQRCCRQFQFRVGAGNFCSVHVSLVPVLGVVGEQKTKPTQHSVAVLRSLGINPHLLACRSSEPLEQSVKTKLVSDTRRHTTTMPQPAPAGLLQLNAAETSADFHHLDTKCHSHVFWGSQCQSQFRAPHTVCLNQLLSHADLHVALSKIVCFLIS